MKLSKFNYYFDTSNGLMIFNSLHEKIAIVNTSFHTGNILDNTLGFTDLLLKNGLDVFLQNESSKELNRLIKDKVDTRLNTDYLYLKILTTYGCNMACVYCYENNSFFSRSITNTLLSKKKSDEIVEFACSVMERKKLKYIYFSWW